MKNLDASIKRNALIGLGVVLFLYLIFPTPYEYSRKEGKIYRANRFTGKLQHSTVSGWRP